MYVKMPDKKSKRKERVPGWRMLYIQKLNALTGARIFYFYFYFILIALLFYFCICNMHTVLLELYLSKYLSTYHATHPCVPSLTRFNPRIPPSIHPCLLWIQLTIVPSSGLCVSFLCFRPDSRIFPVLLLLIYLSFSTIY